MTKAKQKNKDHELQEGKNDLIKALVFCLALIIIVRSFLFEPFKIPSSSMFPTLKIGDYIFVSKYNFGLTIPFTKIELINWRDPKRGEVIVFLSPRDESLHYIKRVIGVPGDKIEFKGRDLYINGDLVHKEKVTESFIEKNIGNTQGDYYLEDLNNVKHLIKFSKSVPSSFAKMNIVDTIPENKFFVVGDSRDDSYDSRFWGFVPRENIKGKAQMIWLSLDHGEGWDNLLKVRWSRCGTLIY